MITGRLILLGTIALATAGCAVRGRTTLQTVGPSVLQRTRGPTDTVSLRAHLVVKHRGRDSLALEYWGVPTAALEYRSDDGWLPAILYAPVAVGSVWPQRLYLRDGDSLAFSVRATGIPGPTFAAGDRWLGRLPGQYRFRMRIHRCIRKAELACPTDIVSEPFALAQKEPGSQ